MYLVSVRIWLVELEQLHDVLIELYTFYFGIWVRGAEMYRTDWFQMVILPLTPVYSLLFFNIRIWSLELFLPFSH